MPRCSQFAHTLSTFDTYTKKAYVLFMVDASPSTQATRIIHKFGGVNAMARALEHKNPSTVQGWKLRGWIPQERHAEVIVGAKREGVILTAEDFYAHVTELLDVTACAEVEQPSLS